MHSQDPGQPDRKQIEAAWYHFRPVLADTSEPGLLVGWCLLTEFQKQRGWGGGEGVGREVRLLSI